MKIALVFSGQGRSVTLAHKTIKEKILDKYDTDVYCHLWWNKRIQKDGYIGREQVYPVPKNLPKLIRSLYTPKQFLIEDEVKDFSTITANKIVGPNHFLSQFSSIQRACNLFDWSEYDFILKWRYDLAVYNFPDLVKLNTKNLYTGYANKTSQFYSIEKNFSDLSYILPNDMYPLTQIINNISDFNLFNHIGDPEFIMSETLRLLNFQSRMVRLFDNEFFCNQIR